MINRIKSELKKKRVKTEHTKASRKTEFLKGKGLEHGRLELQSHTLKPPQRTHA